MTAHEPLSDEELDAIEAGWEGRVPHDLRAPIDDEELARLLADARQARADLRTVACWIGTLDLQTASNEVTPDEVRAALARSGVT